LSKDISGKLPQNKTLITAAVHIFLLKTDDGRFHAPRIGRRPMEGVEKRNEFDDMPQRVPLPNQSATQEAEQFRFNHDTFHSQAPGV
jgi:hypothetical protein